MIKNTAGIYRKEYLHGHDYTVYKKYVIAGKLTGVL